MRLMILALRWRTFPKTGSPISTLQLKMFRTLDDLGHEEWLILAIRATETRFSKDFSISLPLHSGFGFTTATTARSKDVAHVDLAH